MRISNSFSEGEIQVMDFIVQTLLRGGSPNMATRHKEFASLCRKVMAMKGKVHEKQAKQSGEDSADAAEAVEASASTQSSVGALRTPPLGADKSPAADNLATAV